LFLPDSFSIPAFLNATKLHLAVLRNWMVQKSFEELDEKYSELDDDEESGGRQRRSRRRAERQRKKRNG
jgi:hypothetical protein